MPRHELRAQRRGGHPVGDDRRGGVAVLALQARNEARVIDERRLIAELARWADETFTDHRDPERVLVHLQREVTEALVAVRHELDDVAFEFADLFMLTVDAARRYGLEWDDLMWFVQAKHEINLQRTWGKPDAAGVIEHVRQR